MVDRESLNRYSAASSRAVELAKRDLERFWGRLDLSDPDKARDALLEFIPVLVSTYGDLVATAAMEWYDEERAKVAGLPEYRASSDIYTTSTEQAVASTRYAAGHLYTDNQAAALAALAGTVHRLVKDAGRDVIARNVRLDPAHPRYARVPRGAKTCAWCSILASRGWVYLSKESANLHGKGHDHCDCELVPSWKASEAYMEGYDPDALYAQYGEARRAVIAEGGDPNDLSAIAAKARSLYPEAYTDGAGVVRPSASAKTLTKAKAADETYTYKKAKYTDPEHWKGKGYTVADIIAEQGWYGKIRELDDEQFEEALKASKYPAIYRGLHEHEGHKASDLNKEFLSEEDPWIGSGVYGRGWYTTTLIDTARIYARKRGRFGKTLANDESPRDDIGEALVEMVFKPSARIASLEQLIEAGLDPSRTERASEWGAMRGYDAVELPGSSFVTHGELYYLVVNRTALVARRMK